MNLTGRIIKSSLIGNFCFRNQSFLNTNCSFFFQRVTIAFLSRKSNLVVNGSRNFANNLVKEQGITLTKRLAKKKKLPVDKTGFRIVAYSTAEEYNLEDLLANFSQCSGFEATVFGSEFGKSVDVIHAVQNPENKTECQDVFFFREGSVVMWNMKDSEIKKILNFLKQYEDSGFVEELIVNESESMSYIYSDVPKSHIIKDSLILSPSGDLLLEKYAVSNAMALSVLLGAYEANLVQYIATMEPVTEDLKSGVKIKMSRNEVLQKTGQLFALRHNINLNSDLLDTPDFYWDRDELEVLYQKMFNYFCINKRTKVINEKLNHCIELVELLSSHLNDKHHVRLEWMIIILIMVEVGFEIVHYIDKYL